MDLEHTVFTFNFKSILTIMSERMSATSCFLFLFFTQKCLQYVLYISVTNSNTNLFCPDAVNSLQLLHQEETNITLICYFFKSDLQPKEQILEINYGFLHAYTIIHEHMCLHVNSHQKLHRHQQQLALLSKQARSCTQAKCVMPQECMALTHTYIKPVSPQICVLILDIVPLPV